MAQQLKITLPLRKAADRPNEDEKRVTSVPELIRPYIPRQNWMEFCDEMLPAQKAIKGNRRYQTVLLVLLIGGILMFAFGEGNRHAMDGQAPYQFIFVMGLIVMIATLVACMRNIKKSCKLEKPIKDACGNLSNKLKTVKICYETLCKTRGSGENQKVKLYYQLVVHVAMNEADMATNHWPFMQWTNIEWSETVRMDDHWEIVGGTGSLTRSDFEAAHRAATMAPTEVPFGSADNNNTAASSMPREAAVASTAPTEVPSESVGNDKAVLIKRLDDVKGTLTKEQYEATLAKILQDESDESKSPSTASTEGVPSEDEA